MYLHRTQLPRAPRPRIALLLRLLPLLLFFAATVGIGLASAVSQSLVLTGPVRLAVDSGTLPPPDALFSGYRSLFAEPGMLASIGHTLVIAAISAIAAVALGAVGAYLLWCAPAAIQQFGAVYRLPIIMPHIVVAFLTVLFWSRTGLVASVVHHLGIDVGTGTGQGGFPHLVYSSNGIGIAIAYVYKGFPFVMLLCLGVLSRTPRRLIETAAMLGAGPVRTFYRVILPLLIPTLNQILIILFLYALGGFDIPWLLGASRPQMLPVTVYSLYFQSGLADRTVAMAALSLVALGAVGFTVLFSRLARRLAPWERVV
ncbi:MAG: ABC transporter permease subunit [Spirochaeta sp.]|jgi:putative spermidine/putrescine transport system permease protein|nr:ABC transporter permease subunit [Spirochaeta sp.]